MEDKTSNREEWRNIATKDNITPIFRSPHVGPGGHGKVSLSPTKFKFEIMVKGVGKTISYGGTLYTTRNEASVYLNFTKIFDLKFL